MEEPRYFEIWVCWKGKYAQKCLRCIHHKIMKELFSDNTYDFCSINVQKRTIDGCQQFEEREFKEMWG